MSLRRIFIALLAGFLALTGMAGCAGIQHSVSPAFSCTDKWVVLPFHNYSEAPQAGQAMARMVENALRSRGLQDVSFYPASLEDSLGEFSLSEGQYDKTLDWARWQNAVLGITGSITEWRYKGGPDGEPAAGMTLSIVDIKTGKVLWSASGAQTGWSSEALSGVGLKLVRKLIGTAQFKCP